MRVLSVLLPLCLIAASSQADEVSGLVLDLDGKPVPKARIVVTPADSKEERTLATDDAGRFRLDLPPFRYGGTYRGRVIIAAPGLALDGGTLQQGDNTFRLESPATARGRVVDIKGKPVAGISVTPVLLMWDKPHRYVWLRDVLGANEYSAKTDQAGNWTIENLPASAKVDVELVDERFVRLRSSVLVGSPSAEPLIARPAAVLTGKVVDESGKPLAGVEVFAQGQRAQDGWARDVSKDDGSYRLNGLADGTYNIMTDVPPQKNMVAAALEGVYASEGKTVQLENLVATPGAIVEGVVTDAESGKPVAGASIGSYGPHRPQSSAAVINVTTDAAGRYSLRVAPGDSRVYVMGLPEGYVQPEQGSSASLLNIRLQKGQKTSVPFRLPRALTLSGVAVDESGAPATGATIYIGERFERDPVTIDATGRWSVTGLKAGNVSISISTGQGQGWSLVTPQQVKLPHNQPLRLVLRRLNLLTATARVLSSQGEPLAGAQISAQILTPIGNEGMLQSREAIVKSRADGAFSVGNLRPDDRISTLTARMPGYVFSSGGKVAKQNDAFTISDVVLAKLEGRLVGRVLGTNNAPVPGAKVLVPEGGSAALTETDKDGRFALQSLPDGEVTVLAFASGMTGQARLRTGNNAVNAEVSLQLTAPKPLPANDIQRAYAILEKVATESAGKEYYARRSLPVTLAPFDRELANKLQLAIGGATRSDNAAAIISSFAHLDAPGVAQLAPQLIAQMEGIASTSEKTYGLAMLGLKLVETNPDLARTLYEKVRALVKTQGLKPRPGEEYFLVTSYGCAAALAARLGQAEAEGFSDAALVVAEQSFSNAPSDGREGQLDQIRTMLVELAAQGSATLAERIASELPAGARLRGLSRAVTELAAYDLVGAQRLLELIASSEQPAPTQSRFRYSGDDPEFSFGLAAKSVIAELGKTDPAAALALARRVKSPEHKAMALALAAQVQDDATAAEVFRQAIAAGTADYSRRGNLPQLAMMAFNKNPALGRELFEELKPRYTAQPTSAMDDKSPSAFAFYYVAVDPAESRLMLEREWARQLETHGGGGSGWGPRELPLAMAAIDVERALEMAQALPGDNARFDIQRKIAQYVLASPQVRRTMPFDRWNASDTWMPGTPSQW